MACLYITNTMAALPPHSVLPHSLVHSLSYSYTNTQLQAALESIAGQWISQSTDGLHLVIDITSDGKYLRVLCTVVCAHDDGINKLVFWGIATVQSSRKD